MPPSVLVVLIAVVACYIAQTGAAALSFFRLRGRAPNPPDAPQPTASVLVPIPEASDTLNSLLNVLRNAEYPDDRYEVILITDESLSAHVRPHLASSAQDEPVVRHVEGPETASAESLLKKGAETAKGSLLLVAPATADLSPTWLPSMVQHHPGTDTLLRGPITYRHNERFLSRLQALEQVGRTAALVSFLPTASRHSTHLNLARPPSAPPASSVPGLAPHQSALGIADPEASLSLPPPAETLGEYIETTAHRFAQSLRQPGWKTTATDSVTWLTHTVLLIAGAIAVALPAWRQPTLLAFLAKMGADLLLFTPAARHFGQRGLLRSLVPTELFLVLAVPGAGLLAGWQAFTNR